jgi:DNA repair exonuclease SbcCD ATPase subunit
LDADCGVGMKLASDTLKIVSHEEGELAKKPLLRAGEQNSSTQTDNDNLMDLLGEIEGLKQDIHERMRRVEAVKQAKSVLLEDAVRTEALNKRLTEIGKVMSSANPGLLAAQRGNSDSEDFRKQPREFLAEAEPRYLPTRALNEGLALPWRRPEDSAGSSLPGPSEKNLQIPAFSTTDIGSNSMSEVSRVAFLGASQRLEEAEQGWREAWKRADEAALESKRLFEEATSRLNLAVTEEERAASDLRAAQEALVNIYRSVNERIEEAERRWSQIDESTLEAKHLLEESTSRLDLAASKEESAASQFRFAKEALAAANQAANEGLEEAERYRKQTDQVILDARSVLAQSTSQLHQARRTEESVEASLEAARQEYTAVFQSAKQQFSEAERLFQKGDQAAKEAQNLTEQLKAELIQARSAEDKAAADLLSARQELTTAYQFASVAAQRTLESAETFRKASRWAVFATGLSWVAAVWAVCLALRSVVPIWGACIATAVVVLLAVVFSRMGTREV